MIVLAIVKLVAFTSPAAPSTASTTEEVLPLAAAGIADACAEVAIAAAAMLSGPAVADPGVAWADVGTGAGAMGETVAAATAIAVGSNEASEAEVVAAPASVACPELA